MFGSLDISVSGMIAQRTRMEVISTNIAHQSTTVDEQGKPNPFRRRLAVLMPGDPNSLTPEGREAGVHVAGIEEDQAEFRKVYDPKNPLARPAGDPDEGYVFFPNIDPVTEQVNAVDAMRAYEANAAAAEATKAMLAQALRLIA